MKTGSLLLWVWGLVLFLAGCGVAPVERLPQNQPAPVKLANPASTHCLEKGGKLELRSDASGGQYGVCVFSDGSECEEWAYLRGECGPGDQKKVPVTAAAPTYVNESYGFSLAAPAGVKVEKLANQAVFRPPQGQYNLVVGFQWVNEQIKPFRPEGLAGQWQDSGALRLLDQDLPRRALVDQGKVKGLMYGPARFDRLEVTFWVDAELPPGKTYASVDLTRAVQLEAETIIASFGLVKK